MMSEANPTVKPGRSVSQKRRARRKNTHDNIYTNNTANSSKDIEAIISTDNSEIRVSRESPTMSSKDTPQKTKEEVLAAREAKKKAKQKGKCGGDVCQPPKPTQDEPVTKDNVKTPEDKSKLLEQESKKVTLPAKTMSKGKDEVDRAVAKPESIKSVPAEKSKDEIKADRAVKKLEKQAKKKGADSEEVNKPIQRAAVSQNISETVKNILDITKDVQEITAKANPTVKPGRSVSQKRRARRKNTHDNIYTNNTANSSKDIEAIISTDNSEIRVSRESPTMSSKDTPQKTKEEVLAAREAKKKAKQKGKCGGDVCQPPKPTQDEPVTKDNVKTPEDKSKLLEQESKKVTLPAKTMSKGKDEVDRAVAKPESIKSVPAEKSKDEIKADRAVKKLEKQAKKKGADSEEVNKPIQRAAVSQNISETVKNILDITKDVQEITAKPEESTKSKAELRAERRAKQEAQRAAKQSQLTEKPIQPAAVAKPRPTETSAKLPVPSGVKIKDSSPKPKKLEKAKSKFVLDNNDWFNNLDTPTTEDPLSKVPLNSSLHPAIIKLGVQLATRVVTGANARCIALLDALKKMVSDYTLPAKTEFARGLEPHISASMQFLETMRPFCASQTNALKYIRHHLTQLPNNVDEFDAKKSIQEEIDRYIYEQIDMAGEAISIAVRGKISNGDLILTYGFSSLIERILREAWEADVQFKALVAGTEESNSGREMYRRLTTHGVPTVYLDITDVDSVMPTISKVVVGASALFSNGWVLGACGTTLVAQAARAHNVPLLVCCETHKVSEHVHTDAPACHERGNPDDLLRNTAEDSQLRDWRNNPNVTLLNLTYDVTPPSLVTAVVTELAVLPCTSAPVVLRFKLCEFGV